MRRPRAPLLAAVALLAGCATQPPEPPEGTVPASVQASVPALSLQQLAGKHRRRSAAGAAAQAALSPAQAALPPAPAGDLPDLDQDGLARAQSTDTIPPGTPMVPTEIGVTTVPTALATEEAAVGPPAPVDVGPAPATRAP